MEIHVINRHDKALAGQDRIQNSADSLQIWQNEEVVVLWCQKEEL